MLTGENRFILRSREYLVLRGLGFVSSDKKEGEIYSVLQ